MPSMKINGKKVKFKFEKGSDGHLSLKAVEVDGKQEIAGYLLRINEDGTFKMEGSVNTKFGLKLTGDRKVVVN